MSGFKLPASLVDCARLNYNHATRGDVGVFFMAAKRGSKERKIGLSEASPHYHGHRERLRARFREAGNGAVSDYELLELVLFRAIPQRDVKPLAKDLIARFGSFAEVVAAPAARLAEIKGMGDAAITELKIVHAAASRLARGQMQKRPMLSSWSSVIDYCRTAMAYADKEQFRLLFLDKRNQLIADELQQVGTVDHTPVYPREVVKRALELSATALILVHNHPSGDPTPSRADIQMTQAIIDVAKAPRHFRARPHHRRQGRPCQLQGLAVDLAGCAAKLRDPDQDLGTALNVSGCSGPTRRNHLVWGDLERTATDRSRFGDAEHQSEGGSVHRGYGDAGRRNAVDRRSIAEAA